MPFCRDNPFCIWKIQSAEKLACKDSILSKNTSYSQQSDRIIMSLCKDKDSSLMMMDTKFKEGENVTNRATSIVLARYVSSSEKKSDFMVVKGSHIYELLCVPFCYMVTCI